MPHIGSFPAVGFPKPFIVPAPAFVPLGSDQDWIIKLKELRNKASLSSQEFNAPVCLPNGVTVTKLTLVGYRTAEVDTLELRLIRVSSAGSEQIMATVVADWLYGYGSTETTTISYAKIDNANYFYGLRADVDPDSVVTDARFTRAVIEWI